MFPKCGQKYFITRKVQNPGPKKGWIPNPLQLQDLQIRYNLALNPKSWQKYCQNPPIRSPIHPPPPPHFEPSCLIFFLEGCQWQWLTFLTMLRGSLCKRQSEQWNVNQWYKSVQQSLLYCIDGCCGSVIKVARAQNNGRSTDNVRPDRGLVIGHNKPPMQTFFDEVLRISA